MHRDMFVFTYENRYLNTYFTIYIYACIIQMRPIYTCTCMNLCVCGEIEITLFIFSYFFVKVSIINILILKIMYSKLKSSIQK